MTTESCKKSNTENRILSLLCKGSTAKILEEFLWQPEPRFNSLQMLIFIPDRNFLDFCWKSSRHLCILSIYLFSYLELKHVGSAFFSVKDKTYINYSQWKKMPARKILEHP